jgi:3-isopropylmalate/(R)-2-methylmalate dehydratase small subunit
MQAFKKVTGVVAPLDRQNVDTDSITPARYLKRIERTGWGEFLFYDWRYNADGSAKPDFVLNDEAYRDAAILVAGRNFGSGSSREHAVWSIYQYGIRAVIAPKFADIFHKNCFENGLVPVIMPEEDVETIMAKAKALPGYRLTVDLEACEVSDGEGFLAPFVVHSDPETHVFRREALLNGLDEIAMTLSLDGEISAFEKKRERWLTPVGE